MAELVEEWLDGWVRFFLTAEQAGARINIPVIWPRNLPKDSGRMCALSGKKPEKAHKISHSSW